MQNKKELIGLVSPCGCAITFCFRWFGFSHWWKYIKLRYYWRLFWAKLEHTEFVFPGGSSCWIDSYGRCYKQFPGPCMTNDEYNHWFVEKNNENVRLVPEVEER